MSTSRVVRAAVAGVVAVLVLLPAAAPALAHVRTSDGWSEIRADGDHVRYRLGLEYEILARAIGMGEHAIEAPDDGSRRAELAAQRDLIETYLAGRVRIVADEIECAMTLEGSDVEQRPATDATAEDVAYAVLDLDYDCHGATSGRYVLDYSVFSGAGSDAVVDDHTTTVDYHLGGERGRVVLDGAYPRFSAGEQSFGAAALRSVGLGAERVLTGLDHALFVAALAIGATSLAQLARGVAAFAVTTAVGLLAVVAGWVSLPGPVTGALVALSVVYVAATNLVGPESRWRLPAVAAAGLLHGFALAGGLRFGDDLGWDLATSVAGVGLGIALGQAVLAAGLFALATAARRYAWFSLAHLVATAVTVVTGLAWFVHRLL
ncbi:HupE/UreJ family protein [Jiangella sp. DSM 45060]|uniref:HupE/UreJ family protein n=1 Tax=Jiangella sp. DSM 45060 TaxID=1798224 RepID=UPI00087DF2D4|nr:HupE/UreJ family protein [Jiangella sp. DSM 45060]SDT39084.1 HupE / UreJ protein [Jiangella sp. DSM 45060]